MDCNSLVSVSRRSVSQAEMEQCAVRECRTVDINNESCIGEYYELPLYSATPALHSEVVTMCNQLTEAFPQQPIQFFKMLCNAIEKAQMSLEHLQAAIDHLVNTHRYSTFTIADIIDFAKGIKVADCIQTLRYLAKNKDFGYSDVVVIRWKTQDNERKMYALKADVDNAHVHLDVIGVWDDVEHKFKVLDMIRDKTIPARKEAFMKTLLPYCNKPPKYNGKYDVNDVKAFYCCYTKVVDFGDKLFYETFMNKFDVEIALENFCRNRHR